MEGEMKYVSAKSLECPMCMNIFKEPKILSCSHTFCKACLERLLECQEEHQIAKCPICRIANQLPNGDVSQLPTNLALQSLLEEAGKERQLCADCKAKGKNEKAEVHCKDCGKHFCLECKEIHDSSGFRDHEVLPLNEGSTGKASPQRRRKCKQHPEEEDQCLCHDCRRYVCIKCGVTDHVYKGHEIIDASEQESNQRKIVEELKSKANVQKAILHQYLEFIHKQELETNKVKKQCIDDIKRAYDESVQQLGERKEILVQEVNRRIVKIQTKLNSLKKNAQQQTNQVTTMTDLVAGENQVLLEMEALTAHITLREDLQDVLTKQNLDYDCLVKLGRKGKQIAFYKNVDMKDFGIGSIYEKNAEPTAENGMNTMTSTPDGMMAVGCCNGGIKIFSADGLLQKTVLDEVKVRGLGFLSDGRCVVCSTSDVLALFTPEYEQLHVEFEVLNDNHTETVSGGFAVTSDDKICVGNAETNRIELFSPAGGKGIKEILCTEWVGKSSKQITNYDGALLVTHSGVVEVIDERGQVKHKASRPDCSCHAAVTRRNTVFISWVKHTEGVVSIEEYTTELRYVHAIVSDYKFDKPERNWYSLQEFTSGEIAFCTAERLYIFKHGITSNYL